MLKSRFPRLFLRSRSRVSASASQQSRRLYSSQDFHSRCYSKGANYKDPKLGMELAEEKELLHSNAWRKYVIPTGLLMIVGAGTYIHYNDEKRAILQGSQQNNSFERSKINRAAIGGPFKLFDTENHLVTDSDLRGSWTLMYFGYTSSPDVGPQEVQKMAEAVNILESNHGFKISPVFITIDPQRDCPAQLKAYLEEFDSRIIGLTGPIGAIRQMAQEYRVYFKKVDEEGQDYLVECSHSMYLLDPNMEIVRSFGTEYDASQLSEAIMIEVKKALK